MRAIALLFALSSGLQADASVAALLGGANGTDTDTGAPPPQWSACRRCWLEHDSLVTVAYKVDVIDCTGSGRPASDVCVRNATGWRRTLEEHCPSCGTGGGTRPDIDAHLAAHCREALHRRARHSVIIGAAQKVVTAVGFVTNVISLKVLMRSELRRYAFNHLLQIVNVNDIVLMSLIFILDVIHLLSHTVVPVAKVYEIAKLIDPLVMMSFMFSIYMLLLTTLNRWAAVCRPLAVVWISKRHVNASAAVLLLAAVAFNAVRFADLTVAEDGGGLYYRKRLADWSAHPAYMWLYKVAAYVAVYGALPLAALLALGGHIAWRLLAERRRRRRAVAPAGSGDGVVGNEASEAADRDLAALQLAIAVTFVVCGAPKIVYVAVTVLFDADKLDPYNDMRGLRNTWSAISSVMLIANGLLNDVLCYVIVKHYRETANDMFKSCFRFCCKPCN